MPDAQTWADDCASVRGMVRAAYAGAARVPLVVCPDWENEAEPGPKGDDGANKTATFWEVCAVPTAICWQRRSFKQSARHHSVRFQN